MEVGGQRRAPAALPPGKLPGIHFTGGRVGAWTGADGFGTSLPDCDSIPGPSSP